MPFKNTPLIDFDGHCAILLGKVTTTSNGIICNAVGDPHLPPTVNTVWVPDSLNFGENMALVTLGNPSNSGWNPQAISLVYELITNEDKKLAAEWVINQSYKLPLTRSRYRSSKNKTMFEPQFVQLAFNGLDTHVNDDAVMELNVNEVLEA